MNKHIKTIITIVCAVAILVCVLVTIKEKAPSKKEETTTVNIQTGTDDSGNPLPRVVTDSNGITKAILDPSQICDNSEPVIINKYDPMDGSLADSLEFVISDAIISREFKNYDEVREERTEHRDWLKKFYDVEMLYADDKETYNDGIAFYVYITATITNLHPEEDGLSVALDAIAINKNNDDYEATMCVGSGRYLKEYGLNIATTHYIYKSGIDLYIDGDESNPYKYKTGEGITAEIMFCIPDEYIENDNLYLAYSFGKNFNRAGSDINQKYIKVNITNRGDYFE
ncbi:MAG: hypothetical protein IKL73_06190 [Lachnospiraceae bacterium]|nr:hypothetical protein [Lachnospiraceae bacterium]